MRQWHTPQVVEIALGLEINCYMCAELYGAIVLRAIVPGVAAGSGGLPQWAGRRAAAGKRETVGQYGAGPRI